MKPMRWVDAVLDDARLPADARAVLIWLGRRPKDWQYSAVEAASAAGMERKKYQRTLQAIRDAGWVMWEQSRDRKTGHLKQVDFTILDAPPQSQIAPTAVVPNCTHSRSPKMKPTVTSKKRKKTQQNQTPIKGHLARLKTAPDCDVAASELPDPRERFSIISGGRRV